MQISVKYLMKGEYFIMNKPLVSIIIPVYNSQNTIKQNLDSLLNQTYKNIEIICVDDGSTDNSLNILKEYSIVDNRIHIFQQNNLFAGAARNNGLTHAKGEFVLFLDADDFFEPQLVEKCVSKALNTKADIVLFGARKYDENTSQFIDAHYLLRYELLRKTPVFNRKSYSDILFFCTTPCPWTKFYRKDFIIKNRLEFQNLPNSNDLYFTFLSLCVADKITYIPEILVNYRIGQSSNTQSQKVKNPTCFITAFDTLYKELNARGLYSDVEKTYIDAFLSSCVYNINTTPDKAKDIYLALSEYPLNERGFLNHPIEYYRNKEDYITVSSIPFILSCEKELNKNNNSLVPQLIVGGSVLPPISISVIIPVYNVELYIEECVNSIITQTIEENIEIICVNDGSTDRSLDILKKLSAIDSRITIINQENSGLSVARNTGVQFANGEYIYFLDGDDYIEQNALSVLYNRLKKDNLDVLFFDGSSFSDIYSQNDLEKYKYYYLRKNKYEKVYTGEEIMSCMLRNGDYKTSACLQIIRKDHFIANNLWFIKGILHEDNYFTFKSTLTAKRVGHTSEILFHRRIRPQSIMTSKISYRNVYGYFITHIMMNFFIAEHFIDRNVPDHICGLASQMLENSREKYSSLSDSEKRFYKGLSNPNKMLFEKYICDFHKKNFFQKQANIKKLNYYVKSRYYKLKKRILNSIKKVSIKK